MRLVTPFALTTLLLVSISSAGAAVLDQLSLRVHGGADWPSVTSSRTLPLPSQGSTFGAGLAYRIAPAVQLTADVTRDRFGLSDAFVTVPEVTLRSSQPYALTTALAGFEVRASAPHGARGALHAGLAGGAGWLRQGTMRFDDMNGPSYSVGGASETHPVVAATVGVEIPTGLPHADLDLGWRELWMDHAYGALRSGAFNAGVVLRR